MQTHMMNFSTDLNTTNVALRNSQNAMVLQRNLRFEVCLLNERAKVTHALVSSRAKTVSFMHLLPLTFIIKHMMLTNSMREKKFLVFKLMDVVDGLEETFRTLALEEGGVKVFERVAAQNMLSLTDTNATHFYALSGLENYRLNENDSAISSILARIFFVGLRQNVEEELGNLLLKFNQVVRVKHHKVSIGELSKWTFIKALRWKYLKSSNISLTKNKRLLRFVATRLLKGGVSAISLKQFVWKRNSFSLTHFSLYMRAKFLNNKHAVGLRDNSVSFLYLLQRLNDKYKVLEQTDKVGAQRLELARSYLLKLAEERLHSVRQKSLLLGRTNAIRSIRRTFWRNLLAKLLLQMCKRDFAGQQATRDILAVLMPVLSSKAVKTTTSDTGLVAWRHASSSQGVRYPFVNKKIMDGDYAYSAQGYSNVLSSVMGKNVDVFFINALALTRFAFQSENKGKSSYRFLQNIDREMVSRYKYVAVYIQDFVRVGFIALFLKKPTFLAQFMALQIEKLPRNRKETKMVRFLIKVVKVFAAQRREVVGLRMVFKGRVNRWRRTKQIVGERGVLPFQSVSTRIEFGSAKAITRKGALGIRLWICYMPIFARELRKLFLDYVEYSQQLRIMRLNRFLNKI